MRNRLIFIFTLFVASMAPLAAVELSGTYKTDYTVTTEFNTVSKGKTLRVTNGATFVMTDAIVQGSIVVDKGSRLIAKKSGAGYLVFGEGTHVEGIDLYYKVRVSDDLVFTRKFPMTLDEVWRSKNRQLIDWVSIIEFCYSSELNGWVSINEIRYQNPFNENLFDEYDIVLTKSATQPLESGCRSLIVKNKAKIVIQPLRDRWNTNISESIIVEKGASLLGTTRDGHKLVVKNGIKIEGLPVYIRVNNDLIEANTILEDLWNLPDVKQWGDGLILAYVPELKGWYFQDIMLGDNDLPKALKTKIDALKAGNKAYPYKF